MQNRKTARSATQLIFACALLVALLAGPSMHAAVLTWDIASGDGATITPGSGNWNTTAGNLVWNNAGANPNIIWSQASTTGPLNDAIFGGTDGAVDAYVITLGAQMAATNVTFNNTGYKITGSTLSVVNGTGNGAVTVAAGKTATINSILRHANNASATNTVNSGGVLNLGGGTTATFNPQLVLLGAGTINFTAGTYTTTVGTFKAATMNQTGGTVSVNPTGASAGVAVRDGGQNDNYTISGTGVLNVFGNADAVVSSFLSLGRGMGNFKATLTLQSGGTVNVGVTANRSGQINLGSYDGNGNSQLDVQGGTLTIGTGQAGNKLIFFPAGANAAKTATMTQSGGIATINGIQFGANTGETAGGALDTATWAADASATLQLTGGSLYIGALGILRGTAANAAALPITIKLSGGTVGASANWSSALPVDLGSTGGPVMFQAADSGGTARNITLSGALTNSQGLIKTGGGTVTLSGANTYGGNTVINAGTLALTGAGVITNSANIVVANNAIFNVSGLSSPFTLASALSSQTLSNSAVGAIISGTNNCSAGNLSLVYDGMNPSFIITNGGMTLSASTVITVNNTGLQLPAGSYKLIAKATAGNVGLVAGAVPASVTVGGTGAVNPPAALAIIGDELWLTVTGVVLPNSTITYSATGPFTYDGLPHSPGLSFTGSDGAKTTNYVGAGATVYSSVNAPTDPGTYYVSNSVAADVNFNAAINTQAFSINKAASVISYSATGPFTYDALTHSPGISFTGSTGTRTTNYAGTGATVYSSLNAPVNGGTYYVSNTVAADSSFAAATNSQAFTISTLLTWDAGNTGNGGTIDAASGAWDTTTANWNTGSGNMAWAQTSTNSPLYDAIFAGADGAVDSYVVTLASQMAALSLTCNNTGYKLTGSTLSLENGTVNGAITVAAGKTATINSTLGYAHNRAATITANAGSVVNLGGGTAVIANPQLTLTGAGTVNITGGTYQSTIGSRNAAVVNQTGGTWTMSDLGTSLSTSIGNNAGRDVNYTVSGTGTLNVLRLDNSAATYTLSLGRSMGAFKSTLTVQNGGAVNVGVPAGRAGQINLGSFDANGHSLLDVQGGTFTVGAGQPGNKLYVFAAGANAAKTATMTQSGGTSIINGIQFGANTADNIGGLIGANTYAADASATLQLSGGGLYVGTQGIVRGSAAASLPITIQLQGGTLGASAAWSSSLDMKLGTIGGGPTVKAADAIGTSFNISLYGILSDDTAVNGTVTKTGGGTLTLGGLNSYSGATVVSNGTLLVNGSTAGGAVTVVPGATLGGTGTIGGATTINGTVSPGASIGTLTISGAATNNGTIAAEIMNGPSADKIVFNGTFHNLGGTLTVTNLGTLVNGTTYDLFDFSSPPSGVAFSTVNLPGGASHWNTTDLLVGGTVTFVGNTAPAAANFNLGVAVGGTVSAQVVGKFATDADVGDVLSIVSVSAPANGTVSIVGGTSITYDSTNGAAGDSFTYTVSDGIASATATVTVSTYSPEGFNRLSPPSVIGAGTVTLSYLGIPGYNYALDWATNLTPPINWMAVITNTAANNGSLNYTNISAEPVNFFRTRHVP